MKGTFLDAAKRVLTDAGEPLHYGEITKRALAAGMLETQGLTPAATLNAQIATHLKRHGAESQFVRVAPGIFGLREGTTLNAIEEAGGEAQVFISSFPTYDEVRAVLPVWAGRERREITGMYSAVWEHRGSPQENVDWSDPDQWIGERLEGAAQEMALATWAKSGKKVNPRHATGHWRLATRYRLLSDEAGGTLSLTERGRQFLGEPTGPMVREIDLSQGLVKLLELLAERGTSKRGDFLGPWREYVESESRIRSDLALKSFLWGRLRNLVDRSLVERAGNSYSITAAGLAYLREVSNSAVSAEPEVLQQVRQLAVEQRREARQALADLLAEIEPYDFEHLIRRLLEEMGYESVEVTQRSNDRGVDVVANIVVGITSIREVVQVKRHRANIQRPVLDALRGSLHRFKGVRGTIITTGGFSKGTRDAAFELGAAPITLIDGDHLLDLLIEKGIGIRKETVELWKIDEASLVSGGDEESDEE